MNRHLVLLVGLGAAALPACGGGGTAGPPDMARPVVHPPALYVGAAPDAGVPANYACNGSFMDPAAPTQDTVVMGTIKDFQDDNPVEGSTVNVFTDPMQVIQNQPIASSTKSDMNGNYTLTVPKGYYRIIRGVTSGQALSEGNMVPTIPTYEFNVKYSDPESISVKESTKQAIPGLVGITQMNGLAVLAGAVHDCDGKEVGGGLIEATVAGTPYSSDGLTFYFVKVGSSTLPARTAKWTGGDGAFAALNLPPGLATVTARGVTTVGGMKQVIAQASVPVLADAITIVFLTPLRGPAM